MMRRRRAKLTFFGSPTGSKQQKKTRNAVVICCWRANLKIVVMWARIYQTDPLTKLLLLRRTSGKLKLKNSGQDVSTLTAAPVVT